MKARTNTHRIGKRLVLTSLCVLMFGTTSIVISTPDAFAKKNAHSAKSAETNYGKLWLQMSYSEKQNTIIDAVFDAVPDPAVATMLDGPGSERILKYFDKAYGIKENAFVPFKDVATYYLSRTTRSTRE